MQLLVSTQAITLALPMETQFFVHIPKTAGTSLRVAAVRTWGRRKVLTDYGNTRHTSPAVAKFVHQQQDLAAFARVLKRKRIRLFCGHAPAHRFSSIFEPSSILTFVRDPVERVVSHYHTAVRYQHYRGSLTEFSEQKGFFNLQSIFLREQSIETLGFVGLTERYTESMTMLNHQLNWNLPMLNENLNQPRTTNPRYRDLLAPDLYAHIVELNQKDHAIYEQACAVFETRYAALQDEIQLAVANG